MEDGDGQQPQTTGAKASRARSVRGREPQDGSSPRMAAFWDLEPCFKEVAHETWGQRTLTC